MMNEHPYFHWDLLRQPLQTPQFGMAPSFFDVNSILELRKEKSRDAARSRRGKENYEFYELAKLLPLPAAITSQLDKASIIRLTISYLKLRNFSSQGDPQWTPDGGSIGSVAGSCKNGKVLQSHRRMEILDPFESQHGTHILQSLDGFAFILANDGRFLYISETVSIYLGLSQVEMAGSSIFDYVHQDDHGELTDNLGMCSVPAPGPATTPPSSGSEEAASPGQRSQTPSEGGYAMVNQWDKSIHKSFCIRMKSTLTKRGAHVKTSGFRVLHILGTLRPQSIFGVSQGNNQTGSTQGSGSGATDIPPMGLVGMAFALPPPTVSELRMEMDTFILRLSPGFKVIYCDSPLNELMDLAPDDVNDRLLYDICHVADLKILQQAHNDIIVKGQALTDYWRMLNRHGGYTWVQTFATTLFNNKTPEDQTVLAINYVISGIRSPGCCVDLWQATGDVTSSMSSTYRCPARDQLLKGLQKKESKKDEINAPSSVSNKVKEKSTPPQKNNDNKMENSGISSNNEDKRGNRVVTKSPDSSGKLEEHSSNDYNTSGNFCDSKNSRRKMDNPRKRKKSEEDSENLHIPSKKQDTASIPKALSQCNTFDLTPLPQGNIRPPTSFSTKSTTLYRNNTTVLSPSPEDLSVKKTPIAREVTDGLLDTSADITANNAISSDQPAARIQSIRKTAADSSVNKLEAAMNRHLQTQALDCKINFSTDIKGHQRMGDASDSTTPGTSSKLLSMPSQVPQGSQWIPSSPRTPPATAGDILPTSDLLRCLYTTRESVIKTNAKSQNRNSYLNGETPSSLLTPPEPESSEIVGGKVPQRTTHRSKQTSILDQNDSQQLSDNLQSLKASDFGQRDATMYKDNSFKDQFQFLPYKDPLSYIDHFNSSTGYKDHMTSAYKDFPQFKDIVPAFTIPNLVSSSSRFQHNYPPLTPHFPLPVTSSAHHQLTTTDSCSITPPASSSPDGLIKASQNHHHDQNPNHHHHHHNQQQPHQQQTENNLNNPSLPFPNHQNQTFDNYSTNDIINSTSNSYGGQLSNKHLPPLEFHPSHHHHPHHPSASSPNNNYHHYRPQDYTTPFHHSQDLSKGSYYGMTPTPVASMYMDLNNTTATYDACHRPTLTWY